MHNQATRKQRRVVFLTGTRADFGKIKPLLQELENTEEIQLHIFVTGMHMLEKFGSTWEEVAKSKLGIQYRFINQSDQSRMDEVLAKTVLGFSDYVSEIKPDMIVVHGDRTEPLAGAIVGSLNNILVSHIEGGEVSGTVDELIRHAITKLSHIHFVANSVAEKRLLQLGEDPNSIYAIGSPELDIMMSDTLPNLDECMQYYQIPSGPFSVGILHPVTTEIESLAEDVSNYVEALISSGKNYVLIYPNNDLGSDIILKAYSKLEGNSKFRILPSMRFEYFLQLLKNADFIIGNSSAGVRQAPFFGTPSINTGTRQNGRSQSGTIINTEFEVDEILAAIDSSQKMPREGAIEFGTGSSAEKFSHALSEKENPNSVWSISIQKHFIDLNLFIKD
jgi:UDP-N-acetylglucosamine 2-epimerase (hydrolysing)